MEKRVLWKTMNKRESTIEETLNAIIRKLFHSYAEHESYMSEIQL